jgi:uncharacterized coiled-coil protein SlyX
MLTHEQQRNASLQQELEERGRQIEQLQAEVQQLKERQGAPQPASAQDTASIAGAAPAPPPAPATAPTEAHAEPQGQIEAEALPAQPAAAAPAAVQEQGEPAVVASLRSALSEEQERRQAVETELERLKEETSAPPLSDSSDPVAELASARSQITELSDALTDERIQRERMADELRVLQQRAAHAPPVEAPPENAELQARLESLRAEKQAAVESFNRSLAASQQRAAELERQLAATQAAAAAADAATGVAPDTSETASMRAENTALRARLDEEHRRTQDLAAKLRTATRVTDLIFKMQAQQAQAQPLR